MREALERVRQVEQENRQKEQQLLQKIAAYKEQKESELQQLRSEQQQERNRVLQTTQKEHEQQLSKQREALAEELIAEDKKYAKVYENKKQEVLAQIIEGVKQANGR